MSDDNRPDSGHKREGEGSAPNSYRENKSTAQSAEKEFFATLKEHGYDMEKYKGSLENIRLTNDYGNKIKVLEYTAFFFGWVGLASCIIAYEFEDHSSI